MGFNFKGVLFIAFAIIVWQAIVLIGAFNKAMFPGPLEVFESLVSLALTGELVNQILPSFWRVLLGLAIGCTAGIFAGLVMGRNKAMDETASPLLNILRAFPPVALIPLMIVWFGITDASKIIAIALAVFFPVWISSLSGAKQIPSDYIRAAKLLTKSAKKRFLKIFLPATTPYIISGVRIGIAIGFIMVFVTELAGASSGLGYFIANAQITYRIDNLIAGLIVLGLSAAFTDYAFLLSTKRIFPWAYK